MDAGDAKRSPFCAVKGRSLTDRQMSLVEEADDRVQIVLEGPRVSVRSGNYFKDRSETRISCGFSAALAQR